MRRPLKKKPALQPDFTYNSVRVAKFINCIMERGKKNVARKVVYDTFALLKEKGDPLEIFENAVRNVEPSMEVRSRRVGGANYQVPREIRAERRLALAMRWIILAARGRKGMPMHRRLADELLLANNKEGEAYKKKENTHKMAEANKAFAHFAW